MYDGHEMDPEYKHPTKKNTEEASNHRFPLINNHADSLLKICINFCFTIVVSQMKKFLALCAINRLRGAGRRVLVSIYCPLRNFLNYVFALFCNNIIILK